MYNNSIAPNGHFDWPIDELSIGVADVTTIPGGSPKQFSLRVFAYGSASIGYTLDGLWTVAELLIDGDLDVVGATANRQPVECRLPDTHPLYNLIIDALIDVAGRRIEDEMFRRIAMEKDSFDVHD